MSQRERNNQNNNNSVHDDVNQKYQPRQTRREEHRIDIESSARNENVDFRVMRCFCGCTALTYEEIEHFAMMNVSSLIVHSTGKTLFQNFLRIGHSYRSETMVLLECFEMCNKLLRNIAMINDQYTIDDLLSLCPSFSWEQKITDALQNTSSSHQNLDGIREVLSDLKQECVHSIECHNDYDRFRRELLRKIGKS